MLGPNDYTVGWICALHTEHVAAQVFLDETHDRFDDSARKDDNDYTLGRIGKHNVVIAILPHWQPGLVSAATVAKDMVRSFPNVRLCLMVGVGGGVPTRHDIRLGDIVVSSVVYGGGGVLQYDYGRANQAQGLVMTGHLNQPPMFTQIAVNGLKAQYQIDGNGIQDAIENILQKRPWLRNEYQRPHPTTDRLYKSSFVHNGSNEASCPETCGDNETNLVSRVERSKHEDNPAIHHGLIASANQIMNDASLRDKLAAEKDVLCFEMEAAGLMNYFPCLVIRGIDNYSDTHNNSQWRGYAAMAAAAYAKDLLRRIAPSKVEAERKLGDILYMDLPVRPVNQLQQCVEESPSRVKPGVPQTRDMLPLEVGE
ncbi:nucleoside phosphorylase domain-containing protein [Biscogniauxia mediterranea]|nr:nucleoside phosphorylase domain-containing protein [Biscogniauxia mediterranea]